MSDECGARREREAQARDALIARASDLGLGSATLQLTPALNWSEFATPSVHANDGRIHQHVELAGDSEQVAKVRRRRSVHSRSERRYPSPWWSMG